jgi:hypothetical protein
MKDQLRLAIMSVLIQVVYASGIESRGPTNQTVDLVALSQQEFCKIRAVLAGDSDNQCFFQLFPA